MVVTRTAERFHDLVSGRARGVGAALARTGMRLASWPYGFAVRARNRLYDWGLRKSRQAGVPVISVGNLTLGGTGKTPAVEWLARFFRERDIRVAILSRGYGGAGGPNDEALVLEDNLPDVPHLQSPDRAAIADTAIEELESELLILDDGFQHRQLARDLDIVLIDATRPWGFGYMFPRGLLREPRNALRRADAVLLTRCDLVDEDVLSRLRGEIQSFIRPNVVIAQACHRPTVWLRHGHQPQALEEMRGRRSVAFCGLGNPAAFRQSLVGLGLEVKDFRTFPDHHAYTREDVNSLRQWAEKFGLECVAITTQKDLVKLRTDRLGACELYALRIGLDFCAGREEFEVRLTEIVC